MKFHYILNEITMCQIWRQHDFMLQSISPLPPFHHHCLVLTIKTNFKVICINFQVWTRTKEHGARRPRSAGVYLYPPSVLSHSCTKRIFLAFEWTRRANTLWLCLLHTKVRFTSSPRSFGISSQHATWHCLPVAILIADVILGEKQFKILDTTQVKHCILSKSKFRAYEDGGRAAWVTFTHHGLKTLYKNRCMQMITYPAKLILCPAWEIPLNNMWHWKRQTRHWHTTHSHFDLMTIN